MTKRLSSRRRYREFQTIPRWRLRRRRNGLPPQPTGRLALPSLVRRHGQPCQQPGYGRQDMDSRQRTAAAIAGTAAGTAHRRERTRARRRVALRFESCVRPCPGTAATSSRQTAVGAVCSLPAAAMRSGRKISSLQAPRAAGDPPQSSRQATSGPAGGKYRFSHRATLSRL